MIGSANPAHLQERKSKMATACSSFAGRLTFDSRLGDQPGEECDHVRA